MRGKRQNKTKRLAPALIAIALAVAIGGGLLCLYLWDRSDQSAAVSPAEFEEDEIPGQVTVNYEGQTYRLRSDLDTFLVMGLDKFSDTTSDPDYYINNQQADFLMLMIVDDTNKSYCALHINRDTMAEIQRLGADGRSKGYVKAQLALAHTFGSGGKDSCRNTAKAISRYLYGVPVDHYLSMTMDAIPILNDLVGGVTVHIDDDFSAVDPSLEQGKDVLLRGRQALTFIRARGSMTDSSNLSRMVRQREYINALYKQMSDQLRENDGFARKMATKLADYTVSDMTTSELSRFVDQFKDYTFTGILTIPGEAVVGTRFMEFYPDETALQELVLRLFFKKA